MSGPFPVGLGFAGLTYLGTQVVRLPFIPDTSLAHEVLHSWWGTGVRPADDGNWAEGLTTFMADYTLRERGGADAARQDRLEWLREFAVLPAVEDRPLAAFRGREHTASQATGYHKAAFVFAMLRDEIGADAFTAGVRRFWNVHRSRAARLGRPRGGVRAGLRDAAARVLHSVGHPGGRAGPDGARRSSRRGTHRLHAQPGRAGLFLGRAGRDRDPGRDGGPNHVREPALERAGHRGAGAGAGARHRSRSAGVPAPRAQDIPPIIRGVAFDPRAATVVVARDAGTRTAARAVAAALFEREPSVRDTPLPDQPTFLVGTTGEVSAALGAAGLDPVPARLAGAGTARVWAMHRPGGQPLVVLAANDAAALAAVTRPLRHYGRESFVVFDGARVIDRGLWQPAASALRVDILGDAGATTGATPSPGF